MVNPAIVSLDNMLVFSSRDWAANPEDAWIYGIIVGWNDSSLKELAQRYAWTPATIRKLKSYRAEFSSLH